jgi:hypothetical protein
VGGERLRELYRLSEAARSNAGASWALSPKQEAIMRNLVVILLIAVSVGATPPAATHTIRPFSTMVPIVYNDVYGHWQCADVTGMCGLGVG